MIQTHNIHSSANKAYCFFFIPDALCLVTIYSHIKRNYGNSENNYDTDTIEIRLLHKSEDCDLHKNRVKSLFLYMVKLKSRTEEINVQPTMQCM